MRACVFRRKRGMNRLANAARLYAATTPMNAHVME